MLRLPVRATFPPPWMFWVAMCADADSCLDSLSFEGLAGENYAANYFGAAGK